MSNLLLSHLYFPVFSGSGISECRIINSRLLGSLTASSIYICTVCPRSSDPSSIVSYYKNWVNTSWLYSMYTFTLFVNKSHSNNLWPSVLEISLFFSLSKHSLLIQSMSLIRSTQKKKKILTS